MGFYTILLVVHTILVIFLILMVLLQRTDSDGMGGLGGGGGNQFMSGRSTANLMTRTTSILAASFMISSLVLAVYASRMTGGSIVDSVAVEEPAAAPVDAQTITKDKAPETDKPSTSEKSAQPVAKDKAAKKDTTEKPSKTSPSVPKPE